MALRVQFLPQILVLIVLLLASSSGVSGTVQVTDDEVGPPDPPSGAQPQIYFEETAFDWQSVLQGTRVRHKFKVNNRGNAPLLIDKVKSNCGCTSTYFDRVIAPGKTGTIELEVDTSEFNGGRPRKNAVVHSNDPDALELSLWMMGRVTPALKLETSVLKLSGLSTESKRLETTISPGSDQPIEIIEVTPRNGTVTVESLKPLTDGRYQLTLTADPVESPGILSDDLNVKVSVAGGEPISVALRAVVEHLDTVNIIPNGNIIFYRRQTAHLDGPVRRDVFKEIHVKSVRADLPVVVDSVEIVDAPPGLLSAEVTEIQEGQHYLIKISVLKPHSQSQASGNLQIRLGGPEPRIKERKVFAQFRLRTPVGG